MNFTPLTQFLSNNQKELIAGVFLLLSVTLPMCKETPAPVPAPAINNITVNLPAAAPAPPAARDTAVHVHHHYHHYEAPRPRRSARRVPRKVPATPLPRPSCPCADSTAARASTDNR
jgi:hypothetical protein